MRDVLLCSLTAGPYRERRRFEPVTRIEPPALSGPTPRAFSHSVSSHNDSSKTLLVTAMASTRGRGFGTLSFDGLQGILNDALKIPVTV